MTCFNELQNNQPTNPGRAERLGPIHIPPMVYQVVNGMPADADDKHALVCHETMTIYVNDNLSHDFLILHVLHEVLHVIYALVISPEAMTHDGVERTALFDLCDEDIATSFSSQLMAVLRQNPALADAICHGEPAKFTGDPNGKQNGGKTE